MVIRMILLMPEPSANTVVFRYRKSGGVVGFAVGRLYRAAVPPTGFTVWLSSHTATCAGFRYLVVGR